MINILADPLKAAGKLLNRLKFTKAALPVLTHLHFQALGDKLTIVVTTLDQWLQTTVPLTGDQVWQESLLVPLPAFKAALKADKGSVVSFARKGRKGAGVLHLGVTTGGITVHTGHPTLETDEFPVCPVLDGSATQIPARTLEMMALVSSCASADETRYVLNGVLFTPEDGGMVVAVDGRRLAAAPATVPSGGFVLPNAAVHVLGAAEFSANPCQVTVSTRLVQTQSTDEGDGGDKDKDKETETHVRFESGAHLLISRTIDGNYPSWKQVVPSQMVASVTIPEDRRAALVTWLRGLSGNSHSVLLERAKRGEIRLSQTAGDGNQSTVTLPAAITGEPAAVALNPRYLADALTIAPCLWIIDELSPVVARRPDGVFCVVMTMRTDSSQARVAA